MITIITNSLFKLQSDFMLYPLTGMIPAFKNNHDIFSLGGSQRFGCVLLAFFRRCVDWSLVHFYKDPSNQKPPGALPQR